MPGKQNLSFTVTPPLADKDVAWLRREGVNSVNPTEWETELLGQRIIVGDVTIAVIDGHFEDVDEHLAAIDTDPTAKRTVKFTSKDGLGSVIILAQGQHSAEEPLRVRPWGLAGIAEHPRMQLALEATAPDEDDEA